MSEPPTSPGQQAGGWGSTFDRALEQETLRTECRRTLVTLGVMLFLFFILIGLRLALPMLSEALREVFPRLIWRLAWLCAGYAAYEAGIWIWQRRLLRAGRAMPSRLRYAHVFIEISYTSLVLIVGATLLGPHQALSSSVPYLYFLFIFLTALNLDMRLCAFAGLVAGVEFLILSGIFLKLGGNHSQEVAALLPVLVSFHQYVIRALFLAGAGLLAGLVARQIRRQVETALRTVEERDRAVSIFGQHVSPQVAEMLLKQPIAETGEERNVCVIFLDIRDFSSLAAERGASEVMEYLNTLFGFMIPLVNRHQGIINKFLGDGFMAVFGAPVDDGEQCRHALEAAFDILEGVNQMNQNGQIPATRVGIGLHMGRAITGNVGSSDRKEYTIIGDVVNLAARVEQATKQFGAPLLVTETVWRAVVDQSVFVCDDLGPVELKGQPQPVRLFRLARR